MNFLKSGMKGCLILVAIGFGFFILFMIFTVSQTDDSNINPPIDTSSIIWDSLDLDQKSVLLEAFIDGNEPYNKQNFRLGMSIYETIHNSVKYPETLEIFEFNRKWTSNKYFSLNSYNTNVTNVNDGKMQVKVDYRAENDYGQKVRSVYNINLKFDGKNYEIIDVSKR